MFSSEKQSVVYCFAISDLLFCNQDPISFLLFSNQAIINCPLFSNQANKRPIIVADWKTIKHWLVFDWNTMDHWFVTLEWFSACLSDLVNAWMIFPWLEELGVTECCYGSCEGVLQINTSGKLLLLTQCNPVITPPPSLFNSHFLFVKDLQNYTFHCNTCL